MKDNQPILFDHFRLDLRDARLFRADQPIPLTPKSFAVLSFLLQHAGRLVTKEEIIRAVWDDSCVSDASLKVCVREVRQVLGDEAQSPRFIETVHRRGYRFIGSLTDTSLQSPEPRERKETFRNRLGSDLVGREKELSQLETLLADAKQGDRQIAFLTGEPGCGKTALVEEFTRRAESSGTTVAIGQCFELFSAGEAFLPILEALSRLCKEPRGGRLVELMASRAPTWMVQMPWLQASIDREISPREVLGATPERMLREICETLEALTTDTPLVLVLEDLHWADLSTVDLISALSRRQQPSQLMVVVTYRPVEVILSGHPLKGVKQELLSRKLCHELPLDPLNEQAVNNYLQVRFPSCKLPVDLSPLIHADSG